MINRLIRNFVFDNRTGIVFSDATKIRINLDDLTNPRLMLRDIAGVYPLDADLFVETPMLNPNAVNKWLKFEARYVEDPGNGFLLPPGTSLGFKVKTTAGNYWWNGSAWALAGASEWSTEAQLNDNFPTFPIATIGNRQIGLVINLRTTNPAISPELKEAKLLGEFDIDTLDDLVYDSIIRKLNSDFRSSSILVFPTSGSIGLIDLTTVLENKGYNITGIRKVFNLTDDPMKLANLFQSYAPGTVRQDGFTFEPGTVTFTGPIPADKLVEVTFEYVPEFYVRQNQDFYEVPKFPSVIFENMRMSGGRQTMPDTNSYGLDFIRDRASLTAVVQRSPRQRSITFEYASFVDKQTDQMRLMNDLTQFFSQLKIIRTWGLDYQCGLQIVGELETSENMKTVDDTDTQVANGAFEVRGVLFYDKPSTDEPLVSPDGIVVTTTLA